MKLNENLRDVTYGMFFLICLVGIYMVQHECVRVAFDGIVAASDTVSHWFH